MRRISVGILGATGVVGQQMLQCIAERNISVDKIVLLASARSAGKKVMFKGQELTIQEATKDSFDGLDFVLGAVENPLAKEFAPYIVKAGAVFIDNSSAFRLDKDVPLVIPEINGEDAKHNNGIIANPNCSTIIALCSIAPINRLSRVKKIIASTYQAVSGAGIEGMRELENQVKDLSENKKPTIKTFPYQIAYNCIPQIGSFDESGFSTEELKMQNEGRKIMHLPDLKVNCTCIRIPVLRSHSVSATLETENPLTIDEIRNEITRTDGLRLVDDPMNKQYPMPLFTSNQDLVFVGRLRKDPTSENGISLWCAGDQVRKGAATNAVQIMETLIK